MTNELYVSGKYNGFLATPTVRDFRTWKATFRCALNSLSDVKEVKQMSEKKGAHAYRVYQFLERKDKRKSVKSNLPKNKIVNRNEIVTKLKTTLRRKRRNSALNNINETTQSHHFISQPKV